jgi:hypothetical protein
VSQPFVHDARAICAANPRSNMHEQASRTCVVRAALSANGTSWIIGEVHSPEICGLLEPKVRGDSGYRTREACVSAFRSDVPAFVLLQLCRGRVPQHSHLIVAYAIARSTSPLRHTVALVGGVSMLLRSSPAEVLRSRGDSVIAQAMKRPPQCSVRIKANHPGFCIKEIFAAPRRRLEATESVQGLEGSVQLTLHAELSLSLHLGVT